MLDRSGASSIESARFASRAKLRNDSSSVFVRFDIQWGLHFTLHPARRGHCDDGVNPIDFNRKIRQGAIPPMFRLDADKSVEFCDGLRRRDFLHVGSLSFLGLGLTQLFELKAQGAVDPDKKDANCIMLFLVGGPSQLDNWDMKPNAPAEIRGPYKPIKTNVPGIEISENFPRMAKHADKYALIRSVYHTAAAVHDTAHQMMQTGRLFTGGIEYPHIGRVPGKP